MTKDAFRLRPTTYADLPALKQILDATGLFPSDMLDAMIDDFLSLRGPDIWLSCERGDALAGFAFCQPERMTEGTWNLLAIAVRPDLQGVGAGAAIVAQLEATLAEKGARLLLVETSGMAAFARTRSFYRGIGYRQEACIRDYYAVGDDKIVFSKPLAQDA